MQASLSLFLFAFFFVFPVGVPYRIERIMWDFLWSGDGVTKKDHLSNGMFILHVTKKRVG